MAHGTSSQSPDTILRDLDRLTAAWAQTDEGLGGRAALAGFEYQINKALLASIRARVAGGGLVVMEALSDVLSQDNGIVVAQLKLTLSSSAMLKGLKELWAIECLARKETPNLRTRMRYEIHAAQRVLKDDARTLAGFTPVGVDAAELAEFKSRVSVVMSASPRLEAARLLVEQFREPQPFALLDGYAGKLLRASTPELLKTTSDEFDVELKARQAQLHQKETLFGLWGAEDCSPAQIHREEDLQRAVRTGQRLRRSDLREGRLADRRLYDGLHRTAEEWLSEQEWSPDKIPAFWIEGRSGAGKSAALLHLLARLHAEDPQRVILWLGPDAEKLEEALGWARSLIQEGRQVIIGLDDPMAPERHSRFQQAAGRGSDLWETLRLASGGPNAPPLLPPVVICCGPTEQKELAEDQCAADLDLKAWLLPHETEEDLRELATWYRARTGREAPDLSGEVLLVQRFFEWNVGSLHEWAVRFRDRLRALPAGEMVFDLVARILAFGRLYAEYPAEVLRAATDDDVDLERSFEQLAETEKHLSFRPDEDGSESVRLTHPHLADAIYREWFSRNSHRADRRRHLRDGLRAWIARTDADPSVRFAALWAIARLGRERDQHGRRLADELRRRVALIAAELKEVLPEIYKEIDAASRPLADLPVWVALDFDYKLRLDPSPLRMLGEAVSDASAPARGLRLACHILLAHGDAGARVLVKGALDRLADWRDVDGPWHDWPPVAVDFMKRGGAVDLAPTLERLTHEVPTWSGLGSPMLTLVRVAPAALAGRVGGAWLSVASPANLLWPWVLRSLLERNGASPEILALALNFLRTHPSHPLWGATLSDQLGADGADKAELVRLGLGRLGLEPHPTVSSVPPLSIGFGKVWAGLFDSVDGPERTRLRDLALSWLDTANAHDQSWSYVFVPLWKSQCLSKAESHRLYALVQSWFAEAPEHHGWSFVFHAVLEVDCSLTFDMVAIGATWLKVAAPHHAGQVYVIPTLLKACPTQSTTRHQILQAAERWLQLNPDHPGWSVIWQTLAHGDSGQIARAIALGRDWLSKARPSHGSWRSVFQGLFRLMPKGSEGRADLADRGAKWLVLDSDDIGWHKVLEDVVSELPPGQAGSLWAIALARLESKPDHPRWSYLYVLVDAHFPTGPQHDRLKRLGFAWINYHLTDPSWPRVWRALAEAARVPADVDLLFTCASQWLSTSELSNPAWFYFWVGWNDELRRHGRASELPHAGVLGSQWLGQAPLEHKSWYPMWLRLKGGHSELLESPALMAAQRSWLVSFKTESHSWGHVLSVHLRRDAKLREDPDIAAAALEWLRRAPLNVRYWPTVWHFALEQATNLAPLCDLADDWLRTSTSDKAWHFIWACRVRVARLHEQDMSPLIAEAEAYLSGDRPVEPWIKVWTQYRQVTKRAAVPPQVLVGQVHWLAANPNHPKVKEVLGATRHFGAQPSLAPRSLLEQGIRTAKVTSLCWTFLWDGILQTRSADAPLPSEVGDSAQAWLVSNQFHRGWAWVWCALWEHQPAARHQLMTIGHDRLKMPPSDFPGRGKLSRLLFAGRPRRPRDRR